MKAEEIEILVKHRIDQAREALNDAKYLVDGKRSSQSIVNRAYYAMFYAALALLQSISKNHPKNPACRVVALREAWRAEAKQSEVWSILPAQLNIF